jgi:Putative amidoligase enzyme
MVGEKVRADKRHLGGVEMVTPILNVSTDPIWRKHVEVAWEYLRRDYHVTSHGSCGTHIHISLLPNYDLRDLQRIASSAIYFEPAIEALVPADRRQNVWVRSNWRQSPLLMRKGRSRLQSVADIERATTKDEVISLMQHTGDNNFTWNFSHLMEQGLKQTIEFRKPPASMTSAEALSWAELTMTFVQASIQHGTLSNLRRFEVNIGGLLRFLKQVNVPGVNEPHRLQRIWAGKPLEAAWEL